MRSKPTAPAAARVVGIEVEVGPSNSVVLPAVAAKADGPALERPKSRLRTSTSYVARAELMRRTLGINVLQCPVCQATMLLLAVITMREVIDRILTHVKVPREAVEDMDLVDPPAPEM